MRLNNLKEFMFIVGGLISVGVGFLCCGTLENVFDSVHCINWQWKKLAIGNVVFGRLPNYLAE